MKTLLVAFLTVVVTVGAPAGIGGSAMAQSPQREFAPLQWQEQIPVPGVAGRMDHFSADPKRQRLFVAALGNNSLEVLDVFAGRMIHRIEGLARPQGVLYVPAVDKLYVANAADGTVRVYDGASYRQLKTIDFGVDPDNLRYDAGSNTVFVGFGEEEGGIAMIDPTRDERIGQLYRTNGHPESFQVSARGGRIYVNVPDAGHVVLSIDRKSGAIAKWPLPGLKSNYAMALDEEGHRLFTVARKPPTLVVLNTQTGAEVARLRVVGDCDDIYFDAARKRIYAIGGAGAISVFQQKDPDHYELIANVPSGIGVRTGYVFGKRDRLYVAVPAKANEPAQIWTYDLHD